MHVDFQAPMHFYDLT